MRVVDYGEVVGDRKQWVVKHKCFSDSEINKISGGIVKYAERNFPIFSSLIHFLKHCTMWLGICHGFCINTDIIS